MPGSKKPRKPMRHRLATLPVVIRQSAQDDRNLKLIPHQEMALLREGKGTEQGWHTLACRINLGSVLAMRHDWSDDPKPVMRAALDALRSLKARAHDKGRWLATGDELRAIGEALTLADDMQDAATRRQHRDALRIVMQVAT